jgi:hypothetical protein
MAGTLYFLYQGMFVYLHFVHTLMCRTAVGSTVPGPVHGRLRDNQQHARFRNAVYAALP